MLGRSPDLHFHEVQRFRQWWLWMIVYGIAVLIWWGFVQQIMIGSQRWQELASAIAAGLGQT